MKDAKMNSVELLVSRTDRDIESKALQCTVILKNRQFGYGNLFLWDRAAPERQCDVGVEVGLCDCVAFGTAPP